MGQMEKAKTLRWTAKGISARCMFCGGEGRAWPALSMQVKGQKGAKHLYCCGCDRCDIHTIHGETPEEAVENWNKQLYSADTLMLMNSTGELSDAGAERLLAGILRSISKDYTRAYANYVFAETEQEKKIFKSTMKQCKEDLRNVCGWADMPQYSGALKALEVRSTDCVNEVRKGINKLINAYFCKKRKEEGAEDDG